MAAEAVNRGETKIPPIHLLKFLIKKKYITLSFTINMYLKTLQFLSSRYISIICIQIHDIKRKGNDYSKCDR